MKRKLTALMIGAVALIPGAVHAQEYGLSQGMIEAFSGGTESQIVIRVRKPGDQLHICSASTRTLDPRYNVQRPETNIYYVRPGGSNYFQLPTESKNPDIVGCIDRARNVVYINIFRAIQNPQPKAEPAPYNPSQPPIYLPNR